MDLFDGKGFCGSRTQGLIAMGIISAITSFVEFVKMMKDLVAWVKATFGDNPAKFIKDSGTAFAQLHAAQTVQEKQNAAKAIQDLFARIP